MRLKSGGTQQEIVNVSNEMKKKKNNHHASMSRTHRTTMNNTNGNSNSNVSKEGPSHKKIKLPLHSRKTSEIVTSKYY